LCLGEQSHRLVPERSSVRRGLWPSSAVMTCGAIRRSQTKSDAVKHSQAQSDAIHESPSECNPSAIRVQSTRAIRAHPDEDRNPRYLMRIAIRGHQRQSTRAIRAHPAITFAPASEPRLLCANEQLVIATRAGRAGGSAVANARPSWLCDRSRDISMRLLPSRSCQIREAFAKLGRHSPN
jgi:hypothetical protein